MINPSGALPPLVPQPARRPSSLNWLWWTAGGCSFTILVGIVGAFLLAWSVISVARACVPTDFPVYPGSLWLGGNIFSPGGQCGTSRYTLDDSHHILSFYEAHLRAGSGSWTISAEYKSVERIDFKPI